MTQLTVVVVNTSMLLHSVYTCCACLNFFVLNTEWHLEVMGTSMIEIDDDEVGKAKIMLL